MVRYRVTHRTMYSYAEDVSLCHNEAQLTPRMTDFQLPHNSEITVNPRPAVFNQRQDFFGNRLSYFSVQVPHNVLEIVSESLLELLPRGGPVGSYPQLPVSPSWESSRDALKENWDIYQFRTDSPHITLGPGVLAYAKSIFTPGRPILEAIWALTTKIHDEFSYSPGSTKISTTVDEVLRIRKGVCQDFAHLAIGCLRSLGLAARYVSGYVETAPKEGPKLQGADASHAWFAAYIPTMGWFDFDPTNRKMPVDEHITVSYGRDYSDITPIKGIIYGGGKSLCKVSVDVARQS